MKRIFLLLTAVLGITQAHAQFVHKIKADSVLITNDSCTAELNLENSTKHIKGFLYNKGNGRTEFRQGAIKLNDSSYLVGADTITVGLAADNFIQNQNIAAQEAGYWINGTARVDNRMIVSVPDTGASTPPYSYQHTPSVQALRLGTNDAPITSINNNALISLGRHNGPGIMIYDNLNTKADCSGIGIVPYAMQFYTAGLSYTTYFTWNIGGYQTVLGTNELMRLKNNGNLMLGTTTDEGYKLSVNGAAKVNTLLQVTGKGIFTDTLTATTMSNSDSSNRVATTAWIKQQHYGSGDHTGKAIIQSITTVNNQNYTVAAGDYTIIFRNLTATRTITLPSAASSTGRILVIVNAGTSESVSLSTSVMVDDSEARIALSPGNRIMIQSDGTDWWEIK